MLALLLGANFASDVKLLTRYLGLLQHFSDLGFVLIHTGRVNVSVASLESGLYSIETVLFAKLIGAVADHGNFSASV